MDSFEAVKWIVKWMVQQKDESLVEVKSIWSNTILPVTEKYVDIHWIPAILKSMTPADLKAWRKQHGYTQKKLADALGVIKLTVGRWETGDRHIPSFLHLALGMLELAGGAKKPRDTKTRKEVRPHGERSKKQQARKGNL